MELIRRGICRDVLLVGRWAVKIPTARYGLWSLARGYLANHEEARWSGVDGLCPVRWSLLGGVVNVMPRCEPLPADLVELYGDGETKNHDAYAAVAPSFPGPDRKPDNLGLLDGRTVWVDYDASWNGCPHTRWLD